MVATGQAGRLDAHLEWYRTAFDVRYLDAAHVDARRAWLWPLWDRRFRDCTVLRALNLLGAIPALTARWAYGIPFVVSHGADYEAIAAIHGRSRLHLKKWGWLRRLVCRHASAVLVSNPALARRLARQYPKAAILPHPNWVDLERFSPTDQPPVTGRVLYVGRLVEEKNLGRLATAVNSVWGHRLRAVGEGPLRWYLATQRRVDCPGPISWERLPDEYRAAECFALPSLTEGHPKALAEAMACGVPAVVATRVAMENQLSGVIECDPVVEAQIAEGIKILQDSDTRKYFAAQARAHAERHWDARVLMPQEIAILQSARP